METIQHIIIDNTLKRIGEPQFTDYLCHAYCHDGYCTFERNGQAFRFEAGDCMIIARRGDLVKNLQESEDFRVDVIYVTQKFIELSTPQSNYGMRGQLFLFQNRDIGYYADKLCVTSKYLSEVCKKVSGLPAAFWITRYTALDISRLLRDCSLSFTDISDMFGFSSLSHFSRYVQTNLGAKPSDFRE